MSRARDIAFAAIAMAFLSGAIVAGALRLVGVPLPEWLPSQEATYLSGGVEESHLSENLGFAAFAEKRFQDSFEIEIGNNVPAKAQALLGNAALQRLSIAGGATLFGLDCYPTFFGSSFYYIPSQGALTEMPGVASDYKDGLFVAFAQGIAEAARAYPNCEFVVFAPQRAHSSPLNPVTAHLKSGEVPETVDRAFELGEQAVGDVPDNLAFMTRGYATLDEYYTEFYRSDHHWNAVGALNAYNDIADRVGLARFDSPGWTSFDGATYTGAFGRNGLMAVQEPVADTRIDFSGLTLLTRKGEWKPWNHDAYYEAPPLRRHYSFYDLYLDVGNGSIMVENPWGSGTALLLSDSYGGALQGYLSEQFATVHVSRELHSNVVSSQISVESRFSRLLDEYDPDVVIIVAELGDMIHLMQECPDDFVL